MAGCTLAALATAWFAFVANPRHEGATAAASAAER
jgi:hypothetical protein